MGRRLVPSSTIQHRMNLQDARVQAEQRRREAMRSLHGSYHASVADAQRTQEHPPLCPADISRPTCPYRLPDGRIVAIHADVARGAWLVSFALADGRIVDAVRVDQHEGEPHETR